MKEEYLKALHDKDFQNYVEFIYDKTFEQMKDKDLMSDFKIYIYPLFS